MKLKLSLALGLLLHTAAAQASIPTDAGAVSGVREGDAVVYKGIPVSIPPVGNLRWRAPQPVAHWDGVLRANKYKPQCMQNWPPLPTMPAEKVSEDCLYLNLWTPASPLRRKRPVMVWIHGGGFVSGSASTPLYWGNQLAQRYGVIVVNLSYRVGAFGFLAHPKLSAEASYHASGNYAFLDVIAGLRWVQRNITAFGGDPGNVTIFGQSAGAWVINNMMISPLAQGLFQRAIAESEGGNMAPAGTGEGMSFLSAAEQQGVAFANAMGAHSIAELRKIPAATITAANAAVTLPNVDGYVIPDDPYKLYAQGKQSNVPLLLGYNADESAHMFNPEPTSDFIAHVRQHYGTMADRFFALYPVNPDADTTTSQSRLWVESSFAWHIWTWARLHAAHNKVFYYYFTGTGHATHGAELPYVFLYDYQHSLPPGERALAEKLSAYWTNFARTGDPNAPGLPQWPAFTAANEVAITFGKQIVVAPLPDRNEHVLMDAYMTGLRSGVPTR